MTVVDVRSYSRISGSTSALTESVSSGARRRDDRRDPLLVGRDSRRS